eukprot:6184086-Pyramimonas_sp.AAC.1
MAVGIPQKESQRVGYAWPALFAAFAAGLMFGKSNKVSEPTRQGVGTCCLFARNTRGTTVHVTR